MWKYFIVEESFPARTDGTTVEALAVDGIWEPYGDVWELETNGRGCTEAEAEGWWDA